jgi:hypothetical protein
MDSAASFPLLLHNNYSDPITGFVSALFTVTPLSIFAQVNIHHFFFLMDSSSTR